MLYIDPMNTFAALADPTRAEIVGVLATRDYTVNEIVDLFPISQPSISRHLRILREAGLVSVEANGRQRLYRLDARPLREIDAWLARYRKFWTRKLDALDRRRLATCTVHFGLDPELAENGSARGRLEQDDDELRRGGARQQQGTGKEQRQDV